MQPPAAPTTLDLFRPPQRHALPTLSRCSRLTQPTTAARAPTRSDLIHPPQRRALPTPSRRNCLTQPAMSTEDEKLLKEVKKLPWDERLQHK
ncbi:hypothetical protein ABZP36_003651 [Zizania latifolia]